MQSAEGQVGQNVDMCAMCVRKLDVLNERDFFEDIFPGLSLVQTTIDDGQSQGVAMPEKDERWHVEELIYFSSDTSQSRA